MVLNIVFGLNLIYFVTAILDMGSFLFCRDQVMVRLKAIQGWQMKVMRRMKMNTVKHFVEAAVEIIMQMSFGLAVTSARGGFTGSA